MLCMVTIATTIWRLATNGMTAREAIGVITGRGLASDRVTTLFSTSFNFAYKPHLLKFDI